MFIAYVKQKAEGCDYTIGCGIALWFLSAKTKDEAIDELKSKVIGDDDIEGGYIGENELERITLFEVVESTEIPLSLWYKEGQEIAIAHEKVLKYQQRKKLYEELRSEFE
jgi:hypothetical protein